MFSAAVQQEFAITFQILYSFQILITLLTAKYSTKDIYT